MEQRRNATTVGTLWITVADVVSSLHLGVLHPAPRGTLSAAPRHRGPAPERLCEKGQAGARRLSMKRIAATSISASEVWTWYS